MNWKNLSSSTYNITWAPSRGEDVSKQEAYGKIYATIQYDSDSVTPTSVNIRFKLNRIEEQRQDNNDFYDQFYIIYNSDDQDNYRVLKIKNLYTKYYNYPNYANVSDFWRDEQDGNRGWISPLSNETQITLTKKYNATTFTIPKILLVNNGNNRAFDIIKVNAKNAYIAATESNCSSYYPEIVQTNYYLTAVRQSAKVEIDTDKSVASAISKSNISLSLSDRGDNYCKVIAEADATSATNNFITGFKISYSFGEDTSYGSNLHNGSTGGTVTKYIDITTGNYKASNATRRVNVKCTVTPKYGNDITKVSSIEIKHYRVPSKPGKPVLTVGGKEVTANSGRATVKKDWVFSWAKAIAANSSSDIKGYRMYLYKNGTCIKICDKDGNARATDTWYYDSESTTPTITIYPSSNKLKVNDVVQLKICAYTKNGLGTKLLGEYTTSDAITVKNAGIVYVKIDGEWREGQVYVKISGNWKEAESISVKISGTWKEAT